MGSSTVFPEREEKEVSYKLSQEYQKLFERVIRYVRETVCDRSGTFHRQRVRWWSALALLRCLGSSPAAAAATLRSRAASADTDNPEDADEIGRRTVLDIGDDDPDEVLDVAPGSDPGEEESAEASNRRRLLDMARQAETLQGNKDEKLKMAADLLKGLLRDGFHPIVFCRFIPTAEYLAGQLRSLLPKEVETTAVTGLLPPAEREERIRQLVQSPKRILVCTDCLSEGINLQEWFDAVFHYDLSWNPTRHEQREGRVDRFGQPRNKVRVVTYWGTDTQIDGIVLDVLMRKHKTIRNTLGISIPVPVDTNQVLEAIFEGLLLREETGDVQPYLPMFEDFLKPQKQDLFAKWDSAAEREKRSRTMFAQETIKVEEVMEELEATRAAIGSGVNVENFVKDALLAHGATVEGTKVLNFNLKEIPASLKDAIGTRDTLRACFELPAGDGVQYLSRTHPIVEGLAAHVMNTALDPLIKGVAYRAGVIRTKAVKRRTTLLLVRLRYHIITKSSAQEKKLLAEECELVAFEGAPENPEWVDGSVAEALLSAAPDENIGHTQASEFIRKVIEGFDYIRPRLVEIANERGEKLLQSHERVRRATRSKGVTHQVEPNLPPDVLGIYVYLPAS